MLRFVGEFDGSRMGYGEDDAQALENIAQQLHDPVQREEIRRLLQSFLDHADPEEEIAVDITLCMEQIAELPPALTPEQAQIEEIAGYLEEAGYAASSQLIEEGLMDYRAHGGKGNSQDVADFIEREFLSEEPEPASLEIAKEFITISAWPSMATQPISVIWKRWALPTPPSPMRKSPSRSMPIWSITALSVTWMGSFGAQAV